MKRLILIVALVAGCVAPASGADPTQCLATTTVVPTGHGSQVRTTGSGFTPGGTFRFQAVLPDATVIDHSYVTEGGDIQVDLAWMAGTYSIGPITDLTNPGCFVNLYQFVADAPPSPTPEPTIPPTPHITLPPTDTE